MKMLRTLLVASLRMLLFGGGLASLAHAQVAPELESYTSSAGEFSAQVIRQSESPNGALIVGLHGYGSDVSQIAGLVNVAPDTPPHKNPWFLPPIWSPQVLRSSFRHPDLIRKTFLW